MKVKGVCLSMLFIGAFFAANASIIEFTDRTAWETYVGTFQTETFDDATTEGVIIDADWASAGVVGGKWYDQINDPNQHTSFNFNNECTAFGGDWDLYNPGGPGSEIILHLVGGESYTYTLKNTLDGDFFGLFSTDAFTGFELTENIQTPEISVETYTLDNLSFNTGTTAVPEPGSLSMMLLGLLSFAGVAIKRRK
jgi:hypothetical protein